tara:strand:- start:258 stop:713 length:456 start_codon:yes stop_codon:yes gene_type:complete
MATIEADIEITVTDSDGKEASVVGENSNHGELHIELEERFAADDMIPPQNLKNYEVKIAHNYKKYGGAVPTKANQEDVDLTDLLGITIVAVEGDGDCGEITVNLDSPSIAYLGKLKLDEAKSLHSELVELRKFKARALAFLYDEKEEENGH